MINVLKIKTNNYIAFNGKFSFELYIYTYFYDYYASFFRNIFSFKKIVLHKFIWVQKIILKSN